MNKSIKRQSGVALLVVLIAIVVITLLGISAIGDVSRQSVTVRNDQFRQAVYYAAASEVNVQIAEVNQNDAGQPDLLVESLIASGIDNNDLSLALGEDGISVLTTAENINISSLGISGKLNMHAPCSGESIGNVKVLAGQFDVAANVNNTGVSSIQRQRFVYCWP